MPLRVAVIDRDLCNPSKCQRECYRFCPPVRMDIPAIEFREGIPYINEELCIGCGICVKKCPFKAIEIVNLPKELETDIVHQYDVNGFRLFRLPIPLKDQVLGIVGRNGTGKSTAIKILAGNIIPNFGDYNKEGDKDRVLEEFSGTQLYYYFKDLYDDRLSIAYKPQEIYLTPRVVRGRVKDILKRIDERGVYDEVIYELSLEDTLDKEVKELSGGEIQRLVIAAASIKDADVYLFDEPSSYNDVFQRMRVARYIRRLSRKKYVIVVDHDLAFLDYISDVVSVVYGDPGVYGIFTRPESVRTGINIFLDGYIPSDNIRFRAKRIVFRTVTPSHKVESYPILKYSRLRKRYPGFELSIEAGEFNMGEVVGVVGPNAIGKTTFFKMLINEIDADDGEILVGPENIAYKPQYLSPNYDGTIEDFLTDMAGSKALSEFAKNSLLKPLNIYHILERNIKDLSGGELQKVYIAATLLKDADLYLLDEPSAFIDIEDRLELADAINRFIKLNGKPAAVIDHDIIVIDAISDRIMVFYGEPSKRGYATNPLDKRLAMNKFLNEVGITLRRDRHSGRPRINKPDSRLDREQREIGEYYYIR